MAVCGSCGMMINGEPKLACKAFIHEYTDQIRVDPMANFPIERDLVTSVEDFIAKLASVKPYLIPKEDKPISAGEFKQTPAELKKFKQYTDVYKRQIKGHRTRCDKTARNFLSASYLVSATLWLN